MKNRRTPEVCPACGEDVPPKAKACPSCGACHESGWAEDADLDDGAAGLTGHGYEDEEKFDYERWRAREEGRERPREGLRPLWKITALFLLVFLFWGLWWWLRRIGSAPWF